MCLDSLFSLAGILRLNFVHQSRFRFPTATKAEHSRKMSNAYHVTIWISFELHFPGKEKKRERLRNEWRTKWGGGIHFCVPSLLERISSFFFFKIFDAYHSGMKARRTWLLKTHTHSRLRVYLVRDVCTKRMFTTSNFVRMAFLWGWRTTRSFKKFYWIAEILNESTCSSMCSTSGTSNTTNASFLCLYWEKEEAH